MATRVKFVGNLEATVFDDGLNDVITISSYECMKCHWIFYGDCVRNWHGYTSQLTEVPNFCPMCGSEIEDVV